MKFQQAKKLAVVTFSGSTVRGVLFRRTKNLLEPVSWISETISEKDPSAAWKTVLKQMGRGKDCPLYLTGVLREGICFDVKLADLAPRFQKQALELELPRHLLTVPENARFQFLPAEQPGEGFVSLRVYAVPEKSFEPVAAMLTQSSSHADGFLYPALALKKEDPPFFSAEMDPDHVFLDGTWKKIPVPEDLEQQWQKRLEHEFLPKKEFPFKDFFLHIITARTVLAQGDYPGLEILPDQLQPKRVRKQLKITAILTVFLILNLLWGSAGSWKNSFLEMRSLEQETRQLLRENAEMKRKLKAKEKSQKEITRLLSLNVGEKEIRGKLADLSAELPQDVLLTSLRWNESGVELLMQSSSAQADISGSIRKLPYWKIGQLQQRKFGNSPTTVITLKLVPAEGKK